LIPAAAIILVLGLMACGAAPGGVVDPNGTPSGTYMISVSGASGPVSHTVTVTLQVQ
jgi:hypothetical protein